MDQPIPPSPDPQPPETTASQPSGSLPAPPSAPPQQEPLEQWVTKLFVGPNGIRAGWRVLIFVCIVGAFLAVFVAISRVASHGKPPQNSLTAQSAITGEGAAFLCVLLASWIMAKIEARTIADYGLPIRDAFRSKFWIGTVIGFGSITFLLAVLRACHVFYFGIIGLHGAEVAKYAGLWGLAFLFVGFFEEYFFRGYALFTLTTGMRFWPSAILLSGVFGYIHHGNQGESWLGAFNAGAIGLVFCLILRRTGSLWMAIGFHAAWDWGETYFYGVADSGLVAPGHLFNSKVLLQPAWLSGGTVGPEGSWICTFLIVLLFIFFAAWLRGVRFPNPGAIPDPRKKAAAHRLSFLYVPPAGPRSPAPPAPPSEV